MKLGIYELGPNDTNGGVYCGDAQTLSRAIPDNSINLVFTDPPYQKEYLHLYKWLAIESARILKLGGFLCAMAGGYYLDQVFTNMSNKGLEWYFKIEVYSKNDSSIIWPRRIITKSKPILIWTKGPGVVSFWNMVDVYQGQGKDKRYHKWGQGVGSARYCIEYITGQSSDAVVFDPFVGGGTTIEACKILGLHYLAFDSDPDACEIARQRVNNRIIPAQTEQLVLQCYTRGGASEQARTSAV